MPELTVFIPVYRMVRFVRSGSSGERVAITVRYNINRHLLPNFQLQTIKVIGVEVETHHHHRVFYPKQGQFIISGDLNAKHET